ncbi:c3hc4 type (ring finger) zinc finger containing protein [Moniliophthora roreri MCA 2997]|uniref:C3hc4 type (Ring finger) zinc finger containing protein n=1 Tax=Moniliophthora roreri (strain MCA 2997) TaxID=1381753 RepID=V2XDE9_MONRO|nr:c3hc4 type (ring finger) zinc finger containing protein [Moniliophthora roreri MCA 2997]
MADTRPDKNALRRSRSAGDTPLEPGPSISRITASETPATAIYEPISLTREPQSAGPAFQEHSIRQNETTPTFDSVSQRPIQPPAPVHSASQSQQAHESQAESRPQTSTTTTTNQPPRQYHPQRSFIYRAMIYLGYGRGASPARRILVSLIWNIAWGLTQIITIIGLLAYSAVHKSPTTPSITEWVACDRPLGVWSCLWIGRVVVATILSYWGWKRDTAARSGRRDVESASTGERSSSTQRPAHNPAHAGDARANSSSPSNHANPSDNSLPLPHTQFFRRLSLFSSLYSLSWFLTAHILVYTSVNTCRHSSPHLWWLVFSVLCITYLMILEVIILGLVVFIIGPFILLLWNIFLICIGRHPLQNPHMIKPEIGKLSKSVVDRIPLVMYIPPPPDAPADGPIKIPEAAYSYPPKTAQTPSIPKRRFKFIGRWSRSKKERAAADAKKLGKGTGGDDSTDSWEDLWEKEGYPFVVLDNNRAACAICLMDFEEPRRIKRSGQQVGNETEDTLVQQKPEEEAEHTHNIVEEERGSPDAEDDLRLADAGEGAQPLRLLTCGHVFHKTCLDPWLTDVSGRCPVCQRPVEIPEVRKKKKGSQ